MATALPPRYLVAELIRDAAFSELEARRTADAIMASRWGRRPRAYTHYLEAARRRQVGAGFTSPLLTVTDEQLARADADIGWRFDLPGRAASKAFRDAE